MPPFADQGPLCPEVLLHLCTSTEDHDQAHSRSFIGIAVAIGGNILISLALNCQKLAHKRLEIEKTHGQRKPIAVRTHSDTRVDNDRVSLSDGEEQASEETRLLGDVGRGSYDSFITPQKTRSRPKVNMPQDMESPRRCLQQASSPIMGETENEEICAIAIEITGGLEDRILRKRHAGDERMVEEAVDVEHNETAYLRSKLWWFGFSLMNVGEFGNFLSYAYAPASVVAPLGTVALIANCFFAPLMLKEKFRKRDILGVTLAIFGAVTIVGAGKSSDVRLDHAGFIRAISRSPFIIYASICVVFIVFFGALSAGRAGRDYIFVDVGLCALFGGFTVLATKAVSTLLSLRWIEVFKDWIIYPILAVLAVTGIGQIKYLNRALMKFDSKVVIPTFFVSFNLSAIVGSAILYGDFENVQVHQFTTFLYGCATTFLGVFFLTRPTEETGAALEDTVMESEGIAEEGDGEQAHDGGTRTTSSRFAQSRVTPLLRTKQSTASLVLSAGQYLLLAASPPRERNGSPIERPSRSQGNNIVGSPVSLSRRT